MPTGAQEVYKNPPQRSAPAPYFLLLQLKGNRQFLWKLAYGEFQNLTDCDFCKDVCSAHIAVCQLYDLRSSGRKVKSYFSPFIVVVGIPMYCLYLVCIGGDFFVYLVHLEFHHTENTGIHQMSGQLVQSFLISSFCTAGCATLKHDRQIFKGGAFLP